MRTIHWLDEAWNELSAIGEYVRDTHGKHIADRVQDDLMSRIDALATMPELGTLDVSLHYHGKPVRILHSRHTRIIYTVHETEIVIILLWDNRRDDSLLKHLISSRN